MQRISVLLVALALLVPVTTGSAAAPPALPTHPLSPVDFLRDIKPILDRSCVSCHGPDKQRGGLRLDDGVLARKGSNSGPVVRPGQSATSRLLIVVAGLDPEIRMPPGKAAPLPAREIDLLRAWIDQGAPWPGTASMTVTRRSTHWAFQPIGQPGIPAVNNETWSRTSLDRFVLARLEKEGISPASEADRLTLLRRVTLDLTGLPPTPAEVDAFLHDTAPDAWDKVVDRLLNSPAYGEKWGRHWLDLARYADSDGYEKDTGRPNAWRYRQWVIDALNRDLPYDQFVIEQMAGDLLPGATSEQKAATGFHRNTLTNKEGGVDQEQFRVEAVLDRIHTTGKAFLGITIQCAQCHDHKYDPFSQREFYQFFAFFNSDVEVDLPAPLPGIPPSLPIASGKKGPPGVLAQTLAVGKARKTHVLIRGDFLRPGVEVRPDTPAILPPLPAHGTPSRLELARWLTADDNPLTARVIVNQVWYRYFGRGLVPTLEDFGIQGERPSHPELLDHLARELMRRGWSLKALHRQIVRSATYRQSSRVRPELLARDPYNALLARQARLRLEAETIRDTLLASSGLLVRTVGGPSVRPPQPAGISELTYAGSAKWVASTGPDRYRRGLYTWFQRTSPYPMLMTFDAPDSNLCCVRRERSNTPLQALTLLNDVVFLECARGLAERIQTEEPGSTSRRVEHAFRLCLGRTPSPSEQSRLVRLYEDLHRLAEQDSKAAARLVGAGKEGVTGDRVSRAAWVALARALLNLDEVVTRE
jgi:hypothetical protein